MPSTLMQARRNAGYTSSKSFAETLGIPFSSYARYESKQMTIPPDKAWKFADALECTLDEVYGRKAPERRDDRGKVQVFYDSLDDSDRRLMDEFMGFLEERMSQKVRRERERRELAYDGLARRLEAALLSEQLGAGGTLDEIAFIDPAQARERFERFVTERLGSSGPDTPDEVGDGQSQPLSELMAAYDRLYRRS